MKISDSQTQWAKIGTISKLAFIGKDTIFFGAGCHLFFHNLTNQEQLFYFANDVQRGDGIKCYTGHRTQSLFAFIEKCRDPRIFLKTYPEFQTFHELKESGVSGYLDMVFSETSMLLTLVDFPKFTLTVWNWRIGEKIATSETGFFSRNQVIKCNLGHPVYAAQLDIGTKNLILWDAFNCSKTCVLTKHVVRETEECSSFRDVLWTTEGALFILDSTGSIYTVLPGYNVEKIINCEAEGSQATSFAWYKSGLVIAGPNHEIRHYKKSGTWSVDWTVEPLEPIERTISRLDHLLFISENQHVLELAQNLVEFKYVKQEAAMITDFCIINPTGDYLMALCHNDSLNLFETETGELTSSKKLKEKALVMQENPKFPYVAVGYANGYVELFSAYRPERIQKLTKFYLHREKINSIYFNDCGTVFIAANTTIGRFFIVEGLPGGEMEILAWVDAKSQIVDYMMVLSQNCYRIFTIPVTTTQLMGNKIVRYCVIKGQGTNVKEYILPEDISYVKIYGTSYPNRDRVFYAIPYGRRSIHEVEVKRGVDTAQVVRRIATGHQLGKVQLKLTKDFALTWAYDGLVLWRSSDFEKKIGLALPHHRMDGGVKKSYGDPCGKYFLSLGLDNVLVCTNITTKIIDEDTKRDLRNDLNSGTYNTLFSNRTIGFNPKGELEGKCYIEVEEITKIEKERIKCRLERGQIMRELKSIQKEVQELLTINLEGPDNEKLDLLEFNLDTKLYEQKAYENKKLRKATGIYLKKLIEAQNTVTRYILENFWDKMLVTGSVIKAIFANFDVANYALKPTKQSQEAMFLLIKQQRKLERYLVTNDFFKPWRPIPEEELLDLIMARPSLPSCDEEMANLANLDEEEVEETTIQECPETKISFFGSDLMKFIHIEEIHYFQNELQTYYQTEVQGILSKHDSYRVREYFNEQFNTLMTQKTKEMSSIKERNDRLRHIVSEINYFSEEKFTIFIDYPQWEQVERPNEIREVKDNEVPITPYISPSEQALIEAKAAEAERIRLLLLADDFRERALMKMMNGVLEVRWEDELKKDVPLPKCMIEKEPEHFNEEDLRAVRDYEDKVRFLNSERERYKKILHVEYGKVATSVRDSIKKFNGRLSDLLLLKLKIDSAISQEVLKICRLRLLDHKHMKLVEKEQVIMEKMVDNDKKLVTLAKLISSLQTALGESRNFEASVEAKEKVLERAFKKDFQDVSPVVQEICTKLYRKRPKINLRQMNLASVLLELSKCITTNYRPPTLNQDCLEFLKSVEAMDMFAGVPTVVDESTFNLLCRHRRLRIECEVKARYAKCEVAEGEATISNFHKKLATKKELASKLVADLEEIRACKLELARNSEIQIVMPRGLVETTLTGSLEDFQDAILICRKDVEEINRIILEYGTGKLKALQRLIAFRRKILVTEWEHKRYRMQIEDLGEKLVDISNVKLTKEIQAYLKTMDKDKSLPFEIEVDMLRASYENTIQDRKEQVKRMKKQIQTIRRQDRALDQKITNANVDVCEFNLIKDHDLDAKLQALIQARMKVLLKRSKLVQEIQAKHHEIMMLQTELELLRLKTFPTIKYQILS